jgi:drug/metabolite transporter (DMT)-like permease
MGIIGALLAACTSTAKDLVSKAVASKVHPDISTFASFFFALPFYAVIFAALYLYGEPASTLSRTFLALVVMRGISDVCAEGCKMRAFEKGDVSLVSGLLSLSPLFLAIVSPCITGDRIRSSEIAGIILIVIGGLVLVRRDRTTGKVVQPIAVIYALVGSVAFALNSALDRLAVGQAGAVTSAFAVTVCAALLTLPALFRVPSAKVDLSGSAGAFFLRGFFETGFMVAKMLALTTLPAHVVVGIMRMSMIVTVVVGGAWFNEKNRSRRVAGTMIMYVGLLVLLW